MNVVRPDSFQMEARLIRGLVPRVTLAELAAEALLEGDAVLAWLDANLPLRTTTEPPCGLDDGEA